MWMALIATAHHCFWRQYGGLYPGSPKDGGYNGISPGQQPLPDDSWDTWLSCLAVLVPLTVWFSVSVPFLPLILVFFVVPLLVLLGLSGVGAA